MNNVLSDLGGLARPREIHWWNYVRFRRAQRLQKRCQWAESCNRDLGGEHHLERNAIRALNSGGDCARVPWLPVTFLVRADELCIGQHVALHCSLDLRFRRAS